MTEAPIIYDSVHWFTMQINVQVSVWQGSPSWKSSGFLTNSRVLISNMAIVFQNYSKKIPKLDIFSQKLENFLFSPELCIRKHTRVLASNMRKAFSNFNLKNPDKTILVPNLKLFCLHKTFHLERFEGAGFKYDNSFLKISG